MRSPTRSSDSIATGSTQIDRYITALLAIAFLIPGLSFLRSIPSSHYFLSLLQPGAMLSTAIFFVLLSSVLAQNNDWSKPCLDGECFWDLPASVNASGTVRIWGAKSAISDITTAAGWTILDCDPDAVAQNIRLVCTGSDADCAHLEEGGAKNTLVRLPTSCGSVPFARVARIWVHADQTVPDDVAQAIAAKRRRRQDSAAPQVQGITLDTDFAAADPTNGEVNVAVTGTTIPGQEGNLTVTPPPAPPARRSRFQRRGLFSFIEDAFKKFNSFDKEVTKSLPPLDIDKTFPLFDASIDCSEPVVKASASANVNAKAHAVVSLGASAVGTILPPKLSEFGVFVGLDAALTGTLDLKASATGSIDSGLIDIFSVGIPGLDFPGILTIGPTFKVQAKAMATLDAEVEAKVVLAYNVNQAKLFFPKSDSVSSGGGFTPGDSPLSLSVTPSVASKGVVSAHVIPRVDLGISGLAGLAQATVFLNLDASATMTLSLDAQADASASTDGNSADASVKGCIDVGAELAVNAGADASFFGLFDPSTSINLFDKKFNLFNKCAGASTRRDVDAFLIARRAETTLMRRVDLGCPAAIGNLVKAFDDPVVASSIKDA
ncbi:hypothetical protein MKEN_01387500 [Mycena kentingensis (nom. inval.)]|nr:hypothetical protein MKEN_01387500 [Mycena kentingensis (nom. inval.)]